MCLKNLIRLKYFLIIFLLVLIIFLLALKIFTEYKKQDNFTLTPAQEFNSSLDLFSENNQNLKNDTIFKNYNYDQELNVTFLEKNLNTQDDNISLDNNLSSDLNTSFNEQNLSHFSDLNSSLIAQKTDILEEKNINQTQINNTKKPKLVIIIDDMANSKQVNELKKLNLKLTPSFFPPDKRHKNTPQLALEFKFFMVHLPLEAINYNKPELNTLKVSDSKEHIDAMIKSIKQEFKGLRYINNHTGSLFTSDENAMRKLFDAFKKQDFIFVDSKTIGKTKALKLAKEFNQPYIQRDVFLDNEDNIDYIKNQLKQVINLAYKKGFAIAIAHPRKNTFKALEESKEMLLNVNLVYLNEIYGN
ncbi:divergent polysaccharide deacetylase family protein [Campylobacter sp. TTU-622]|uniref:divergent polysaccharide deacetylase family protein n=1 Tax=Campylobacter sp. TTU-622 TaxID=2800583 RepID=UPI001908F291|nr:divergent polysaccharide deacetylase family protein [Campylobacter sp. TTU-622]MBK1973204.1 divergent polysaccharide deacetylase family protein [Campylobacter sp. TTU-622]